MCHGDSDPVVPLRWGEQSAALLKKINKSVEFRTYKNLAHSSSDEVQHVAQGIRQLNNTRKYLLIGFTGNEGCKGIHNAQLSLSIKILKYVGVMRRRGKRWESAVRHLYISKTNGQSRIPIRVPSAT